MNNLSRNGKIKNILQGAFTNTTTAYPLINQDLFHKWYQKTVIVGAGLATIHENVKDRIELPNFLVTSYFQAPGCNIAVGETTKNLSSKMLTVCPFGWHDTLCERDFDHLFNGLGEFKAGAGAYNSEILPIIMNSYMEQVASRNALLIEDAYLNGDTTIIATAYNYHLTACNGLLKTALNDVTVVNEIFAGPFTVANILDALEALYVQINSDIVKNSGTDPSDEVFIMAPNSAYPLLKLAYAQQSGFYADNTRMGVLDKNANAVYSEFSYLGIPIYIVPSMPDNELFSTTQRNLHWGCDLLTDTEQINIAYNGLANAGDRRYSFAGEIRVGSAYNYGPYVVYLHA